MSGALNVFKTVVANVSTTPTSVYSTPLGYSTVVLMAQIANTGNTTIQVSADLLRTGNTTALVQSAAIPVADAASVLTGRLILQFGDSFQVTASTDNSAQLTLSLLETLTG